MYLNFYHLKKEPFNITPDPDLLFLSPSHKEALAAAIYGVTQRKGFVAIIGEVGVGKTTIVRSFLERMKDQNLKIVYLFNANISFSALLKSIYETLGIPANSSDVYELVNKLQEILLDLYQAGKNVVVIIDEAQHLPEETLRNLHMLSNIETSTHKLIQVVFSGQPEFEKKLSSDPLRQIRQRVVIKVRILPLSKQDSVAYISHRLVKTARKNTDLFTNAALKTIVNNADGIPRVINTLCDNCLITSYGRRQPRVSAKVAREIVAELRGSKSLSFNWMRAFVASGLVFAGIAAAFLLQYMHSTSRGLVISTVPVSTSSVPIRMAVPLWNSTSVGKETFRASSISPVTKPPMNMPAPLRDITVEKDEMDDIVIVKKGDTLARLVLDRYGFVDKKLIERVKQHNHDIINENVIQEGARIHFPRLR